MRFAAIVVSSALALAGLVSSPASAVALFTDGFESGNMSNWTSSTSVAVQQQEVLSGVHAARATATGSPSWAYRTLGTTQSQVYFRTHFKLLSHSTSVFLMRFRTASGPLIATLGVNPSDLLFLRNDVTGTNSPPSTAITLGVWHELQMRLLVNGNSSESEVWLDGVRINDLSTTVALGSSPVIGRVQIGDNASGRTFDVAFDDVAVDTAFIGGPPDTTPPSTPTGLAATAPSANLVQLTWNAPPEPDVAGYTVYRGGVELATVTGAVTTNYDDTTVVGNTTYSYTVDAFDTASPANHSTQSSPPVQGTTPAGGGGGDPIIAAAGDIVCDPASGAYNGGNGTASKCHMSKTADILENLLASSAGLDKILPLGDNQYDCGGLSDYSNAYSLSWGQAQGQAQLKPISSPIPGDNEYLSGTGCGGSNASGYFGYFGAAAGTAPKGWYSYNLGAWHIIALNSECNLAAVGGCGPTSQQGQWLAADLASSDAACTLAYFHKPRFTSGNGGGTADVAPFWTALQGEGVEIVLNGHHHVYERFAPQLPSGQANANGIRQFTVGTGGKSLGKFVTPLNPNSQVRNNSAYGVLKLTLHANSYDFQFISEAGKSFTDSLSGVACH